MYYEFSSINQNLKGSKLFVAITCVLHVGVVKTKAYCAALEMGTLTTRFEVEFVA